jgi:uncharacterized membrane protein YfcA
MNPITILLVVLGVFTAGYLFIVIQGLMRDAREGAVLIGSPLMWVISFIANFFDTLGVGSYATTTSMVRAAKLIPDEKIPGSLNVGYVLSTVLQAFLFIGVVPVGVKTLISMIASAVLGAHFGAGVVSSWPRRKIQIGMGACLLLAAVIMLIRLKFFTYPADALAIELTGVKWMIGLVAIFVLGALMTLGIGLYAPCLILISFLGMNEKAAFPIMMGACAFLMPVAVAKFVKARAYYPPAIVPMIIAGIPAVYLAFKKFSDLDMYWVKVIVICVVTFAGISMLWTAYRERGTAAAARPASLESASVSA